MLSHIFENKHKEVDAAKSAIPLADLKGRAADMPRTRGFAKVLMRGEELALIAEIKMASPSQGMIRPDFDAAEIASIYEGAGAHALSVLTDKVFFQGSPAHLVSARKTTNLPILRKDFIDDAYQVFEARAWGADAILLIVAALEQTQLLDLQAQAAELGLDALVEVHTLKDADRALGAKATLVGVNNRDLSDFTVDLTFSEVLIPRLGRHVTSVSESGLATNADVRRMKQAGANAVLIGTAFCAEPDIGAKVHEIMGSELQ